MKVGGSGGVLHMAWRGVKQVHSIAFNKRKLLSVLSRIKIAGESLTNFEIFKDKHLGGNYIHKCDGCLHGNITQCMDDCSLFTFTFVTCMQAQGKICRRITITSSICWT